MCLNMQEYDDDYDSVSEAKELVRILRDKNNRQSMSELLSTDSEFWEDSDFFTYALCDLYSPKEIRDYLTREKE